MSQFVYEVDGQQLFPWSFIRKNTVMFSGYKAN